MPAFTPPTAAALRQGYASGEDTPSAACERALEAARAADRGEPPLRACIRLLDEDARAAAAAASQRWRAGTPLSLLDGIPLAVKDCLDIVGHPTTFGTRFDGPPAPSESRAIALLRAAGAVLLAKTNMDELSGGLVGINVHRGTPRNPHDPARVCGGSSSGSAAAVAAGLVPLALGTDSGGSVRCPAAFTGLVGLKPTTGRVSRAGWWLRGHTFDQLGLLAQDCADTAAFLATVAPGPLAADVETRDAPVLTAEQALAELSRPVDGLRIGVDHSVLAGKLVDAEVAGRLASAIDLLGAQGARACAIRLPDLELARRVGSVILSAEGTMVLAALGPDDHPRLDEELQRLLATGAHRLDGEYRAAQAMRPEVQRDYLPLLAAGACDVLALPSAGCVAPRLDASAAARGRDVSHKVQVHLMAASLTGLPSLSVPCGFVDGLPVGLQLIGRPWEELTLLRLGAALERAGGSPRRRPALWFG